MLFQLVLLFLAACVVKLKNVFSKFEARFSVYLSCRVLRTKGHPRKETERIVYSLTYLDQQDPNPKKQDSEMVNKQPMRRLKEQQLKKEVASGQRRELCLHHWGFPKVKMTYKQRCLGLQKVQKHYGCSHSGPLDGPSGFCPMANPTVVAVTVVMFCLNYPLLLIPVAFVEHEPVSHLSVQLNVQEFKG